MQPQIQAFYDKPTSTYSYVVYDALGGHAAIIDSVLGYDPKSGRTDTASAQKLVDFIRERKLTLDWILETHAHADHISAAAWLKKQLGGQTGIGAKITLIQQTFKQLFHLGDDFVADGHHFDHLFEDGETFPVGKLTMKALSVPGHTPADVAYQVEDAIFVGDTLFMPDIGTARCDFPGGSASELYHSIQKFYQMPPETRLYMCHDYPPATRGPLYLVTVQAQKSANQHLAGHTSEAEFVELRRGRDKTLDMPVLILPAIQINIRAGELPAPESNGVSYLKIPVNAL
ncbi:MBL fold metallo-hydrolase [Leeia oryzae]|uniref:MBL fold metallo-hydrolase n=1 Tax=Leeia oryzae TaxID=356662 RepID=UPI00036CACF3|nr:MBL fold metallo-hydrolase [Leeia oryzae]